LPEPMTELDAIKKRWFRLSSFDVITRTDKIPHSARLDYRAQGSAIATGVVKKIITRQASEANSLLPHFVMAASPRELIATLLLRGPGRRDRRGISDRVSGARAPDRGLRGPAVGRHGECVAAISSLQNRLSNHTARCPRHRETARCTDGHTASSGLARGKKQAHRALKDALVRLTRYHARARRIAMWASYCASSEAMRPA
jgi:hypothetical protein